MDTNTSDAIICGLGAMGSAVAWQLARRGQRVLGLDRWAAGHRFGSSHGGTRIIRQAYFEHPLYVPLVERAYALWRDVEERTGRRLLHETGGLMVGHEDGDVAGGALRSARRHDLPHERLTADEVRRRFPAIQPADGAVGVFEPRAGYVVPEACIDAHLELARDAGAELRTGEPVHRWTADGDGVAVTTARGTYRADRLVLAAGAWTAALTPGLTLPLSVERVVVYWFEPRARADLFSHDRLPVWVYEYEPERVAYGIPATHDGVKAGIHHQGETTPDPDRLRRDVGDDEIRGMRALLRRFMPDIDGELRSAEVCMYTNTSDRHFIVDRHPHHPQVTIAAGFSGHGFKFASVVGELAAALTLDESSRFDLEPFRIARFPRSA